MINAIVGIIIEKGDPIFGCYRIVWYIWNKIVHVHGFEFNDILLIYNLLYCIQKNYYTILVYTPCNFILF